MATKKKVQPVVDAATFCENEIKRILTENGCLIVYEVPAKIGDLTLNIMPSLIQAGIVPQIRIVKAPPGTYALDRIKK